MSAKGHSPNHGHSPNQKKERYGEASRRLTSSGEAVPKRLSGKQELMHLLHSGGTEKKCRLRHDYDFVKQLLAGLDWFSFDSLARRGCAET